jgi:hypothetical protein
MFKLTKRILTVATVVLAVSVPSVAYARPMFDPPGATPAVNSQTVQNAPLRTAGNGSASSPQGFQWDDAGIGAAGILALLSVGSVVIIARRRRTHHPLTS